MELMSKCVRFIVLSKAEKMANNRTFSNYLNEEILISTKFTEPSLDAFYFFLIICAEHNNIFSKGIGLFGFHT